MNERTPVFYCRAETPSAAILARIDQRGQWRLIARRRSDGIFCVPVNVLPQFLSEADDLGARVEIFSEC